MLISRAMMLFVTVCVLVAPVSAQSQTSQAQDTSPGSAGVFVGALGRYHMEEGPFEGTNAAFGGWVDVGRGQWSTNIDASVSRRLRSLGKECVRTSCGETNVADLATGISSERSWIIGVSALRRFEMRDRPEVLHLVFGLGVISQRISFAFDNPAFGRKKSADTVGGGVVGAGIDFPAGRFVARVQYRLNIGFLSAQQFRVGIGFVY